MIGQHIGVKLVAQEITNQFVEQRKIDHHFSCLMLHKNTTPECSNLKPQLFHLFPSAIWVDLAETYAGLP